MNLFGNNGLASQVSSTDIINGQGRDVGRTNYAMLSRMLAGRVIPVTLTLDTSIYAAGDVLAATKEIPNVIEEPGQTINLDSITVLDKDDQTAAVMQFVIMNANVALGTVNAAPSITDTLAEAVIGILTIPSANFVDLGGSKVATIVNQRLLCKPASGKSLYFGVITAGTPTQTAAGIVVKFGFNP